MELNIRPVWLLREALPDDPYEARLRDIGFQPFSIPVLDYRSINEDKCAQRLAHPERYGGLLITSPRAVRILQRSLENLALDVAEKWLKRPVYTVGPRTADDLRRIGFEPVGEETGIGRELAPFIRDHYLADLPLLFLSGNRRRPELPAALDGYGIAFDEVTIYRTILRDFTRPEADPEWIVFFSPSGVDSFLRQETIPTGANLMAIGPTTAAALRDVGLDVTSVAEAPTPEAVEEAMAALTGSR